MYAIYKGKEYGLIIKSSNFFYLISKDSKDVDNGFLLEKDGTYKKRVRKEDLDTAYIIKSFCDYRGNRFDIVGQKENKLLISTSSLQIAEKFNFNFKEPSVYLKWVLIQDVVICSYKKNLSGFTKVE